MTSQLAPIAVFAYKRAEHISRLLRSLLANPEHASSDIHIFCDGPRGAADRLEVEETRAAVRAAAPRHAKIVERDINAGLANSIIDGVTRLTGEYGRVIVLEDDLLLSPYTLRYLNDALDRYKDVGKVMHVSAYMFPVRRRLPETFFYREATCWGWATWSRAWSKFERDGRKILDYVQRNAMQYEFDVRRSMGFLDMLRGQIEGRNNSWAIRWYGSMRIADGLALHPGRSLTSNLGFDGTGEHCTETSAFEVELADRPITHFSDTVEESAEALAAMIAYRKKHWGTAPSVLRRAARLLRRLTRPV